MAAHKAKIVYPVPRIEYEPLGTYIENRPVALITNAESWSQLAGTLKLPIIVQAEPERVDQAFLDYLSNNVPSVVEAVYVVGAGHLVTVGKVVAHRNKLPLVIVPTELDSDQFIEPHVEILSEGILTNIYTGAAEKIVVDWDVIQAAPIHRRAGLVADMLAVVTGLLDWRYAAKHNKNAPTHQFVPWAAGVSANLASHTIKIADAIGRGEAEALRTLLDLASVSVQLANQLGHARQQEGTEHYFAFALEKNGVDIFHAEMLAPGILLTSALHGQDPSALRDALTNAGIRLDQLRPADIQLAVNDLKDFALTNDLPYAIAHELEPNSDELRKALDMAKITGDAGGWHISDTGSLTPVDGSNA